MTSRLLTLPRENRRILVPREDRGMAVSGMAAGIINPYATFPFPNPDGARGDITVSGAGQFWTINPNAVTLDKIASLNLKALGALESAEDTLPYFTGAGTAALTSLTPYARTLLDDEDGPTALATLGALPLAGGVMTGALGLIAGALAGLSLYIAGDTNTGWYAPAADKLAIVTGGVQRATFDDAGNTILGHTASVPIGPANATTPLVQVHSTGDSRFTAYRWSADSSGPAFSLFKSRGAVIGSRGLVQSSDILGNITFAGDDGTNSPTAASIRAVVDGTPGAGDMPGRLEFGTTADGASAVTQRWSIYSTGHMAPFVTDTYTIGTSALRMSNVYSVLGSFTGSGIFGSSDTPYTRLQVLSAATASTPTLGSPTGAGLAVSGTDITYGMAFGTHTNGNGWIQQHRLDGTGTAYGLMLQPSGGSVSIGTTPDANIRLRILGAAGTTVFQVSDGTYGTASISFDATYGVQMGTNSGSAFNIRANNLVGITVNTSGQVGIGPNGLGATPGYALDVRDTATSDVMRLRGGSAYALTWLLRADNTGTTQEYQFGVTKTPHGWGRGFYIYSNTDARRELFIDANGSMTIGGTGSHGMVATTADVTHRLLINGGATGWSMGLNRPGDSAGTNLVWASYASSTWTTRMRMNASGNLIIGSTSDPYTRFQVCGSVNADAIPTAGSASNASFVASSAGLHYGLIIGVTGSGVSWVQNGRMDGTATTYNLLMQPAGGNIGFGGQTSPNGKMDGGATNTSQTAAVFSARGRPNAFEWGHGNSAGYACTFGYFSSNGQPYIVFNAEAGSTVINTWRTRGVVARGIIGDNAGGLAFATVANANADDQTVIYDAKLTASASFALGSATVVNLGGIARAFTISDATAASVVGIELATAATRRASVTSDNANTRFQSTVAIRIGSYASDYLTFDGSTALFGASAKPQSATAPTTGNDLVNKTYADGLVAAPAVNERSITGAATIVAADKGKIIVLSGASNYTVAFDPVATLGAGWSCWIKATTSIIVTLDPNSSETIDGATTITLAKGQECMVVCNGSVLKTVGLQQMVLLQTIAIAASSTSSGAIELPPGYVRHELKARLLPSTTMAIMARTSTNGGSSYEAGANTYGGGYDNPSGSSTMAVGAANNRSDMELAYNITAAWGHATIEICSARDASSWTQVNTDYRATASAMSNGPTRQLQTAERRANEDNNAMHIYPSTGTFQGTISVWGYKV